MLNVCIKGLSSTFFFQLVFVFTFTECFLGKEHIVRSCFFIESANLWFLSEHFKDLVLGKRVGKDF